MKELLVVVSIVISVLITAGGCAGEETKSITVFCGSASKPAMEEAAQVFEEEAGITVYLTFGGSGTMLSQMKLGKTGDIYLPASPDFMELAVRDRIVEPENTYIIAYLFPVILVPAGNPKGIRTLADLARPGITVAIGNPDAVAIGRYAVELFESNNLLAEIDDNIITMAENVSKLTFIAGLNSVDAVVAWQVNAIGSDMVEAVYLEPPEMPRVAYISGAISTYAEDKESADEFLEFLASTRGQDIFKKHGYLATEEEARELAPYAEIGGEYQLPENY